MNPRRAGDPPPLLCGERAALRSYPCSDRSSLCPHMDNLEDQPVPSGSRLRPRLTASGQRGEKWSFYAVMAAEVVA